MGYTKIRNNPNHS